MKDTVSMSFDDSQYAKRGNVSMSRRGDYELTVRQEKVEKPGLIKRRVRAKMIIILTMIMMTMVIMILTMVMIMRMIVKIQIIVKYYRNIHTSNHGYDLGEPPLSL